MLFDDGFDILLVNAYGRSGMGLEAVDLYWTMPEELKDSISHICAINACSHAGLVDQARTIYEKISVKTEKIVTTMVRSTIVAFLSTNFRLGRLFQSNVYV